MPRSRVDDEIYSRLSEIELCGIVHREQLAKVIRMVEDIRCSLGVVDLAETAMQRKIPMSRFKY